MNEAEKEAALLAVRSNAVLGIVPAAWKHNTYDTCNTEYDEVHGYTIPLYVVGAELLNLRNVAQAADELMATLGAEGEIDTTHPKTQRLLDALYEWRPKFEEVHNR